MFHYTNFRVSAENVEIPPFLQDFEVVKYNILEKVRTWLLLREKKLNDF
jgi:hypothetical protein